MAMMMASHKNNVTQRYNKTDMRHTGLLLLSLAAALASCSSDDDGDYKSPQTENADGRILRQLTINEVPITRATLTDKTSALGAAWNAGDEATYFNVSSITRATLTDETSALGAAWNAGDEATYFNVSSFTSTTMDVGTLTAASTGSTSMFNGSVRCKAGDKVALFYPAQAIPTTGDNRGKFTLSLSGQKGTLTDIAENFHYVYGVAEVTSVTESTAKATIDNMQSLLAVCKFTFTDGTNTIPVQTLTINYYDNNDYYPTTIGYPLSATLTPTADVSTLALTYPAQSAWKKDGLSVTLDTETSDGVYVALFPYSPTGYMHFTVTNSSDTYTGTAKAKLKAGKYYPVSLKLTKQ